MNYRFNFLALILLLTGSVQAASTIIQSTSKSLMDTHWEATLETGGFKIANGTSKTLLLQIQVDRGIIGVRSLDNSVTGCSIDLSAEHHPEIGLCEVAPRATVFIDIDFPWAVSQLAMNLPATAYGTYNVIMEK